MLHWKTALFARLLISLCSGSCLPLPLPCGNALLGQQGDGAPGRGSVPWDKCLKCQGPRLPRKASFSFSDTGAPVVASLESLCHAQEVQGGQATWLRSSSEADNVFGWNLAIIPLLCWTLGRPSIPGHIPLLPDSTLTPLDSCEEEMQVARVKERENGTSLISLDLQPLKASPE